MESGAKLFFVTLSFFSELQFKIGLTKKEEYLRVILLFSTLWGINSQLAFVEKKAIFKEEERREKNKSDKIVVFVDILLLTDDLFRRIPITF